MKSFRNSWLSLAAPLLVLLAIFGFLQRKGNDKIQSIPAFIIGSGLIFSSLVGHQFTRKRILYDLHNTNDEN